MAAVWASSRSKTSPARHGSIGPTPSAWVPRRPNCDPADNLSDPTPPSPNSMHPSYLRPTLLASALLIQLVAGTLLAAERKPNVLIIVADDLGYGELSCQGYTQQIPTPHIDSIAKNGVRFTSGYVSGPYCSPTRAGLEGQFGFYHDMGDTRPFVGGGWKGPGACGSWAARRILSRASAVRSGGRAPRVSRRGRPRPPCKRGHPATKPGSSTRPPRAG